MHSHPSEVALVALLVPAAASLANVSEQALRKAIKEGRLPAARRIATSGHHANRPYYEIGIDDLCQAYPIAKQRWEEEQAAKLAAQRHKEAEQARQAATRQVAQEVRLGDASDVATARAWHIQRFRQFAREIERPATQARTIYVDALASGEISDVPDWVSPAVGLFSASSLFRWEKAFDEKGVSALEPQWKGGKTASLEADSPMGRFALGLLLEAPDLSHARVHELMRTQYGDAVPSAATVSRFLTRWKQDNSEQWALRLNPDKHRSKYMPAHGSLSEDVAGLNDLWEADATKVDLIFSDDKRRWTLCAMVDVFSDRRAFLLVESAGARDQIHLLKQCINQWGLPRRLKTDNGKDYTAKEIQQALIRMEIEHVICPPFRGDRKPHVERGFRLLMHDLIPALPGFCGHNVAEAQDIRARRTFAERLFKKGEGDPLEAGITRAAFQDFLDQWVAGDLLRVRSKGSHLAGKCPQEVVDGWALDPLNTIQRIDPVILDYLLLPGATRKIQKKGIQHNGHWFVFTFPCPVGTTVEVRDTQDMGRLLVFEGDHFLGTAENPTLTGLSREEVARTQKLHMQARNRALRESNRSLRRGVNITHATEHALKRRRQGWDPVTALQHAEMVESVAVAEAAKAHAATVLAETKAKRGIPVQKLNISEATLAQIQADLNALPEEDPLDRFIRLIRTPKSLWEPGDAEFYDFFATTPRGQGVLQLTDQPKQA